MPQVATNQQPVSKNMSLHDIRISMKRDPSGHGISSLGYDGVLRTFDAERNVLDAVGLNPTQIREYYEGRPLPEQFLTSNGSKISHEQMFSPNAEDIPMKLTDEEKAKIQAYNEDLESRGVPSCVLGESGENIEPSSR
ncbi:uncharacterized protein B0J16DRAFT_186652 [Fusarium flagelliforme]|uniref:Uncharacterized protein n=1 Tax=Fusarium flagelliforme TaxID=2675880 RepID=A0A395MG92_9HYPO|nr:uncharacterized protein B0J16DRAFT_186652 [Fusarium flagelliforme]KAH7175046.1 hypothetical protein B0J16DRAFT_186652 [Fusarium flagelliforme]RFN46917.1 hypothetical protein FIE12Z_8850 [Fusarium flagelliforme]